jgi:diguanylate cyclase (GGDEF)-like protein/PAS domain S-box-containing protein
MDLSSCKPLWRRLACAWRGAVAAWSQAGAAGEPAAANDLADVLERSADLIVQADAAGVLADLNPSARAAFGVACQGPIGRLQVAPFAAGGVRRQLARDVVPALAARGVWAGHTRSRRGAQRSVPFSVMALAHRGDGVRALRCWAVLRDESPSVHARRQIQRHRDILRAVNEALPAAVVVVDAQGRSRFVNRAFERQVGRSAAQILGRTAEQVWGPQEATRHRPHLHRALAGEAVQVTLDDPDPDGGTRRSLSCIPLTADGQVDGVVGIGQEVTMAQRAPERLAPAERDPLTGLFNRHGLEQRLTRTSRHRDGPEQALLYVALDHVSPVDDPQGHPAADRLLQRFARRMLDAVRSTDAVARVGDAEFAILLMGICNIEAAEAVADKVLAAASEPFDIDGRRVTVSARIGVAVTHRADVDGRDPMSRAAGLLERARAAGRGRPLSPPADRRPRDVGCTDAAAPAH